MTITGKIFRPKWPGTAELQAKTSIHSYLGHPVEEELFKGPVCGRLQRLPGQELGNNPTTKTHVWILGMRETTTMAKRPSHHVGAQEEEEKTTQRPHLCTEKRDFRRRRGIVGRGDQNKPLSSFSVQNFLQEALGCDDDKARNLRLLPHSFVSLRSDCAEKANVCARQL